MSNNAIRQRLLSLALTASMVLSLVPLTAFAAETDLPEAPPSAESQEITEVQDPVPPVEEEKPPVDGEKSPVDGEKPPVDGEKPPVDEEKPPVDGEQTSGEEEKPPVDEEAPVVPAVVDEIVEPQATLLDNAYVSSSGNDSTGDGTSGNPYASLQKAYSSLANNGTIYVLSDLTIDNQAATTNTNGVNADLGNKLVARDISYTIQGWSSATSGSATSRTLSYYDETQTDSSASIAVLRLGGQGTVNLKNLELDGNSKTACLDVGYDNGAGQNTTVTLENVKMVKPGNGYIVGPCFLWVKPDSTAVVKSGISLAAGEATDSAATIKGGGTITRAGGYAGKLFDVTSGTVTASNITIDGGAEWTGTDNTILGRGTTNSGITASNVGQLFTVKANAALVLGRGAVLQNNHAQGSDAVSCAHGGAVEVVQNGSLTMKSGSKILNCASTSTSTADAGGGDGGAVSTDGTFTMDQGAVISGCYARRWGSAVYNTANGNTTINGTIEHCLTAADIKGTAGTASEKVSTGAVSSIGTFTLGTTGIIQNCSGGLVQAGSKTATIKGTIQNNVTPGSGGGILARGGNLTIESGAKITGNESKQISAITGYNSSKLDPGGGGIYVDAGTVTMEGGTISDNTAVIKGGGICVNGSSVVTISGTAITGNKVTSTNNATGGGGICINTDATGTVTLDGSSKPVSITGNIAGYKGGGVDNLASSADKLKIKGSVTIENNTAGTSGNNLLGTDSTNGAFTLTGDFTGKIYASDNNANALGGVIAKADNTNYNITGSILNDVAIGSTAVGDCFADYGSEDNAQKLVWYTTSDNVYVKSDGSDTAAGTAEAPVKTLAMAYRLIKPTGGTIHVMDSLTLDAEVKFDQAKAVVIKSDDNNAETANDNFSLARKTQDPAYTGTLLSVGNDDSKVTLESITLDGTGTFEINKTGISVTKGTLTLGGGAKVTKFSTTGSGCTFNVQGATAKMEIKPDAQITENTVAGGTAGSGVIGVGSGGTLEMTGGTVEKNTVNGSASVVMVGRTNNPRFTMSGGAIKENTVGGSGSAVAMMGTATLGTISFGGGAYVYNNKTSGANGVQRNVFINNSAVADADKYIQVVSAFTPDATVGITLNKMPNSTASRALIAKAGSGYTLVPGDVDHLASDSNDAAGIVQDGSGIYLDYSNRRIVTAGVDANGNPCVTIRPAKAGMFYGLVDADGNAVKLAGDTEKYWEKATADGSLTLSLKSLDGLKMPLGMVYQAPGSEGNAPTANPGAAEGGGTPFGSSGANYLYVKSDGVNDTSTNVDSSGKARGSKEYPYLTIDHAYDQLVASNTSGVIIVRDNLTAAAATTFDQAIDVTVTGENPNVKVTRGGEYKGALIEASKGNVTLQSITLDGNKAVTAEKPIVLLSGSDAGTLTLNKDAVITGGVSNGSTSGGGIGLNSQNKQLILNDGAKVTHNRTTGGGGSGGAGIAVTGNSNTVIMKGGEISGNVSAGTTYAYGAGICIHTGNASSKIIMSGGEIKNNVAKSSGTTGNAVSHGGGVDLSAGSLEMSGGTITGNSAALGGGVYVETNGTYTLTGGKNTGNRSADGKSNSVYAVGSFVYNGNASLGGPGGAGNKHVPTGTITVATSGAFQMKSIPAGWWVEVFTTFNEDDSDKVVIDTSDTGMNDRRDALCTKLTANDCVNNGDNTIQVADGKIVLNGAGTVKIDLNAESSLGGGDMSGSGTAATKNVTGVTKSGTGYSYKLGNATVTGKGANTFELSVDSGYFTVDSTMGDGAEFYAGLNTSGTLVSRYAAGTRYTYLSFTLDKTSSGTLQDYLRSHVTFHTNGDKQTVTARAENVELSTGVTAFQGHYYQFVENNNISWSDAYKAAKQQTFNGLTGYLITVTNSAEHNYVYQKFLNKNGWMGATRAQLVKFDSGSPAYGIGLDWTWRWACGPEKFQTIGVQRTNGTGMASTSGYANWKAGEPNGRGVPSAANEGFAQYGYGSGGRWNDLADRAKTGNIQGYYIEYSVYGGQTAEKKPAESTRAVDFTTTDKPAADKAVSMTPTVGADGKVSLDPNKLPNVSPRKYALIGGDGKLVPISQWNNLTAGETYKLYVANSDAYDQLSESADNTAALAELMSTGRAELVATATMPVKPAEHTNVVRDGDKITVTGATNGNNYAAKDEDGNLIGWYPADASGNVTIPGLDPNKSYTVVEAGPDADKSDGDVNYVEVPGAAALPVPGKDSIKDGGNGSVVVSPANKDLTYTVTTGTAPTATTITGVYDEATGSVKFPGLTAGAEYQVSVKDKDGHTTQGPKFNAPCAPAAATRTEDGATISVTGPEAGKTYTLVDNNGNVVGNATEGGSTVSWNNLDPDLTYHVQVVETSKKDTQIPADTAVYPPLKVSTTVGVDAETGKGYVSVGPVAAGDYTINGKTYHAKDGDVLTVDGLKPGDKVTVGGPSASDIEKVIPAVNADALQAGPTENGKTSVTINPTVSGVEYAVIDKTTGKVISGSQTGNGGALTFPGLTAGGDYQVVVVDGKQPADTVITAKDSAVDFKAPAAPVDLSKVERAHDSASGKDSIAITGSDANLEYAIVDRATGAVVAPAPGLTDNDGDGWVSGTNGELKFTGLDPDKNYDVVVRNPAKDGKPAGMPSTGVTLPGTAGQPTGDDLSSGAGSDGKQHITVSPSSADLKYAVVDKATGKVVAPINGGSGDGWVSGTGGKLDLSPLPAGGDYVVVTMPKAEDDTEAPGKDTTASGQYPGVVKPNANAPVISAPAVSADQVTGGEVKDNKTSITIQPADKDLSYGVVDSAGHAIPGVPDEWITVKPDGSVVIDNLPVDTEVKIVTKPKGDATPAKPSEATPGKGNSVTVVTPAKPVAGDKITREPDDTTSGNTDKITVGGSDSNYNYSVVDKNGNVVATKPGDGSSLTFDGLDPDETYEVVVNKKPTDPATGKLPIPAPGPVVAPTVGLDGISGGKYDDSTDPATTSIVVNDPKPGVDYGVKDAQGKYHWADKDGVISGLKPNADYTVVTKPAGADDADSVKGSALKTPGEPPVVSRDESTPSSKDKIVITVDSGKSYAVVDADGNYYDVSGTNKGGTETWVNGNTATAGKLTFDGLDPSKTYTILEKPTTPTVPVSIPSSNTQKPNADNTVAEDSVSATVDKNGAGHITVNPSTSGKQYAVVDKDGNVVSGPKAGGGSLTFDGLLPGGDYTVIMRDEIDKNEAQTLDRGASATVPVAGENGVTTGIDGANRTLTVNPTSNEVKYVLRDSDGKVVEQKAGNADHSAITFSGLTAGKGYYVTTVKKDETASAETPDPKQELVNTPSANATVPSASDAAKDKNSVTLEGLNPDQEYNLMDKDGNLVKDQWVKPDKDGNLKFDGLTAGTDYTVVTREPDVNGDLTDGKQPSGIIPGPVVTTDSNSGGGTGGGGGGGGGGSSTGSTTGTGKVPGGTVSTDPKDPKPGDKVTITVKPDVGKAVDKVTVTDKKGNELEVTVNSDGTFSYVQPDAKNAPVKIAVTFKDVTGDPHTNGVSDLLTVDDHIAYLKGDEVGNFRPEYTITRAEAAQMFYNLLKVQDVTGDASFSDVAADAWYAKAVLALANLEIVQGVGEGKYEPDRAISRAEFVAIAARFADATTGNSSFSDVEESYWAYELIGRASYYGWINGYTDGTFKPLNNITRAEAAKVVNTMLGRSADKSYIDKNADSLKLFPDVPASNWAYYEIAEASNAHDFTVTDGVESWTK